MRKEKGFTMIELLATITILGILSVVAIGSVSYLIKNSKQNFYQSQRNNLIGAAKSYYQANRTELPREIGTTDEVTYGELKNSKYIGKLVASDRKTECDPNDTKVLITKVDKNKYKYKSYLSCGDDKDIIETSDVNLEFNVSYDKINANPLTYNFIITPPSGVSVKMQSYSYTILKNSYNYVGPITEKIGGDSAKTQSFSIDLNDTKAENVFTYSVSVVYKYEGSVKTYVKKGTLSIMDTYPPVCTILDVGRTNWSKSPQTITFKCEDNAASNGVYSSGCQNDQYKVTFKNNNDIAKYGTSFYVYDKAGNRGECKDYYDKIRLDLDPPTCPTLTGYVKNSNADIYSVGNLTTKNNSGTWNKNWLFITATDSQDRALGNVVGKGVGGIYYLLTVTGASSNVSNQKQAYRNVNAEGTSTVTFQVCDSLDNCTTTCGGYSAKLDRHNPSCTVKKDVTDDTRGITIKSFTCTDPDPSSGFTCPTKPSSWIKTATNSYSFTDVAKNPGSCDFTVTATTKYNRRYRTWNTCKTGSPNECVGGTVSKQCDGYSARGIYDTSGKCVPKSSVVCGNHTTCTSCKYDCSYYDSCKSTKNTCKGGWNSWKSWSGWSTSNYCSKSDEDDGKCEDKSDVFYS